MWSDPKPNPRRGLLAGALTPHQKKIAGPAVHYGFGVSIAMFYGAAVEVLPVLRAGLGMPFGAAVWLGAHVITVPALGLSEPVTRSTPLREGVEFGAHLVYGAVPGELLN
jgi:uncharacterized membrane protein YagU involved in acid resistance